MANINEEKDPNNLVADDVQENDILPEQPPEDSECTIHGVGRRNGIIGLISVIVWISVCLYSVLVTPEPKDLKPTESIAIEEAIVDTTEQEAVEETTPETEEVISEVEAITPEVEEVVPEIETPVVDVNINKPKTDVELLACVIYQEAGADYICDDCRRRVADVVLNRVEDSRYPDTIYEVLTQKQQYGRYYWTDVVWPSRAGTAPEKHAVERAYRIAEEVLNGHHSELYGKSYIAQAEFKYGTDIIYCCGIYYGKG